MAFDAASGPDGRVRSGSAIVAGVNSWRRNSNVGVIQLPHFESPVDTTTGVTFPAKRKGLGDAGKVSLEGIVNVDATDQTEVGTPALRNGMSVILDLFVVKPVDSTPGKGYENVVGFVSNFSLGTKVANEAATFTCEVEVSGLFPAFSSFL